MPPSKSDPKPAPKSGPIPARKDIFLKDAYALKTTQDSVDLYGDWAETYDESFARANDYNTPDLIAGIYAKHSPDLTAPVLDIGAGTGLVAEGLQRRGVSTIDALDISVPMLDVAKRKGCYRNLIVADLNAHLDIADDSYGGVTSTGTFTHGHVGPDAIDGLVRIARPGALFVLGIKDELYESAGFAAKFAALAPLLTGFTVIDTAGYGKNASAELQASHTSVALFYKA